MIEIVEQFEVIANNGILCTLKVGQKLHFVEGDSFRIDGTALIVTITWNNYYKKV